MELRKRQPIGLELVKREVVKEADIQAALEYQKLHPNKKLGDILYELDVVDPKVLIEAIGEILGVKGILISEKDVNLRLIENITRDVAKQVKAIPIEIEEDKMKVVFSNTIDKRGMDRIKMLLLNKGLIMEPYITFEKIMDNILSKLDTMATNELGGSIGGNTTTLVDSIIRTGMKKRASDIHIEPLSDSIRVRYRIDGELITAAKLPKSKQQQIIGRLKALSNMHQEKQESQDGRILAYDQYNIRASSQPNVYGEKFVLRLLKKNDKIRNIFELGFPGDEDSLRKTVDKKNSILIVAAPTGAGKTTTLYSIIDFLNKPEINITTIEDPVEIRIEGLNQIEIDEGKTTFSDSLRTVLRQDPDVILVGEIRDKETGEIVIQAGQTGHYVLSTIHTIDSIETITRLRKIGLSDYDIASTLATSISQRLVRKVCPECRRERPFNEEEKALISKYAEKYNVEFDLSGKTYDPIGCKKCHNTGYYDRIGIFEVLDINEKIKESIMNGESSIEIRRKAIANGYKPFVIDAIKKVIEGYTTLDEIKRKIGLDI